MPRARGALHSETARPADNDRLSRIARMTGAVIGDAPLAGQMKGWAEQTRLIFEMDSCLIYTLDKK